nr:retrovirus-related Pol polyprotein from transposon TNT 1-94 [Tanacetum cinerariifolium]
TGIDLPRSLPSHSGKLGPATVENVQPAQEPQVRQTSTASTTIADNVPIPTNSSSLATNIQISLQDVDELNLNAMVDGNTFVNPFANSSTSDANREVTVTETFHVQIDDELSEKELKQIKADDQAIQTILLSLPKDIYAAEKKAKLFNEWEKPEWSRHVTIVHQTKDLHTADYTQLYDFLKYNQKEVDELKAERLAKTQDPLALMVNSNNPHAFPAPHQDQLSSFNQNYLQQQMLNPEDITDLTTAMNMALALMAKAFKLNYSTPTNNNQRISSNPCNRQIAQPGMNMGQDIQMQMVGGNGGYQFRQYAGQNAGNLTGNQNGLIGVQGNGNQNQIGNGSLVAARAEGNAVGQNGNQIRCYNCMGVGHYARNCTIRPRRRDAAYLQTQLLIDQKEEAGIQLQTEEYDLMAAAADINEIEEVNANCILMANMQQASTFSTQTDSAPICLWRVDSGCSKHMTGNLKLLINFVWKFMGTVRFENDHVAAILGFGDLQWGNILITKVYFVEGLSHNLFSVGQ